MLTIGLSAIFKSGVAAIWGTQIRTFPPLFPQTPVKIGEIVISQVYIYTFATAVLLTVIFALFFKFARMGIAMRAAADSQQTALSMGISVKTVDRHVSNLMAKLDIHDRVELARYAIREGLTTLER